MRTTAELLAAGLSAGRIRRLVRDGALCSLRPGVYASAASVRALVRDARDERARQAGGQLLRVAATLAVTGSQPAGSHRSAALVYGLGLVGRDAESVTEITEALGDQGSYTGRRGVRVHIAALPAEQVVSYRGEADGALKYQTPARARTQLERDARLRAPAYEVVHFPWPQVTRAPAQVVEEIQVAFSRGALLGSPGRPSPPGRRGEP